jgi:flagellar biogenesis protein FliO
VIAKRIALAAAAAFVTVNIWTGAPLIALWVGSQAAGPTGLSMTAVGVVVVVLLVLVLALTWLLTRINARYDRLTGRTLDRRVSPWMRSMRSEREDYTRERQGTSAIERVVVISVTIAVLVFNVWFFFFSGSPVGNG